MVDIIGAFFTVENSREYLTIKFSPNERSIKSRWRNNGLSAGFLADYWATFFPICDIYEQHKQDQLRNTINYIANELLENTMKFHCDLLDIPISITLHLFPEQLVFYVTNCAHAGTSRVLREYARVLLAGDIEELYLQQLERNALDESHSTSQMGFLTMLHDYHANLAWQFEPVDDQSEYCIITTMVQLAI